MTQHGAYGSRLGERFGVNDPPTLIAQTLLRGELAVTEIHCDGANFGMTQPIPPEDAFLVGLTTLDCAEHGYWSDGRCVATRPLLVGDVMIHDLNRNPIADLRSPFRSMMFYLPRSALVQVAEDVGALRVEQLDAQPGASQNDPVIAQLGLSLRPALDRPEEVSGLFIDHVLFAVAVHAAQVYGHMQMPSRLNYGGLAPWQERRAKEILGANLDRDVSVGDLAKECRLSVSHFARAFRQSTGKAPHRWLVEQRVEKAKGQLRCPAIPLAEVALACGFADQSHFSRVFARLVGASPGAWRRSRAQGATK